MFCCIDFPLLFHLVLFPRHFKDAAACDKTINLIHIFRDYLHYHIKCSKVWPCLLPHPFIINKICPFINRYVIGRLRPF